VKFYKNIIPLTTLKLCLQCGKCPKNLLNASRVSSFMVGVPKKNKRHQVFFKLFFINNIYMEKN
jgi:hypothetical protein